MCIHSGSVGEDASRRGKQCFLGKSAKSEQNGQEGLGSEWIEAVSLDVVDEAY